jgi:uncharacterized membrane protein YdbT with pleckstrin-like domain
MGNFIKKSLENGEEIKYNGRLHWSSIWKYIFWSWLMVIGGLAAAAACYYNKQQNAYIYVALIVAALGLIIGIIGRIVRTRSEFAITDTRFVQKDGIFNIKMTEIPLQRIETVNYYQTIWQRMVGTGCVELVGSGGTSHQVHCIEHPMQVRKMVLSAISASTIKSVSSSSPTPQVETPVSEPAPQAPSTTD